MAINSVMAQFFVYDSNGKVIFKMHNETPSYFDFGTPVDPGDTIAKAVDLGLPSGTLWGDRNIGSKSVAESGNFYAWGELTSKSEKEFIWGTYKFMNYVDYSHKEVLKYTYEDKNYSNNYYDSEKNFIGDNKKQLEQEDDVASVSLGEHWAMPTEEQMKELRSQCFWVATSNYKRSGISGFIVFKAKDEADKGTILLNSLPPSNYKISSDAHIFLPVGGYISDTGMRYPGEAYYWTNTIGYNSLEGMYLHFDMKEYFYISSQYRYYGSLVRPVKLNSK